MHADLGQGRVFGQIFNQEALYLLRKEIVAEADRADMLIALYRSNDEHQASVVQPAGAEVEPF